MPLTPLPDQGIEVPLSEYNRLRAFQGGGWFWDHDNQQVIREVLGDFLPRVEERRDRGGALFQHFIGGTETASRSLPVGTQMNRVPRAEYQRLQRALDNLKRKAQDPNTDPNARKVIEKFCLPDPSKDPDLYRLSGSGWNRRLIVLWGCEREEGSSIAPTAALSKIAVESPATTLFRRLPMLLGWLLLLIVLIAAAVWWWQQRTPEKQPDQTTALNPPASVTTGLGSLPGSGSPSATGVGIVGGAPTGTPDSTNSAVQQSSTASTSETLRSTSTTGSSTPSTGTDGASNADRSGEAQGANGRDSVMAPDAHAQDRNAVAASGGTSPSSTDSNSSAVRDQSKLTSTERSQVTAASEQNRLPGDARSPATPPPGMPASSPNAGPINPSQPTTANPPGTNGVRSTPPSTPPQVDISKGETDSAAHEGKVDVVLTATAHEDDGNLTPLEIKRWSVDGQPYHDRDGHDATAGRLKMTLPLGKHRVGISGTARGVPVEYETEVNVKITSTGDVTVKPRENK